MSFESVASAFAKAMKLFNSNQLSTDTLRNVTVDCLDTLKNIKEEVKLGEYFLLKVDRNISRPIKSELFQRDSRVFSDMWSNMIDEINTSDQTIRYDSINTVLYTSAISFAVMYDLYKPGSRKTPGTFFEFLIAIMIESTIGIKRGKHISLIRSVNLSDEEKAALKDLVENDAQSSADNLEEPSIEKVPTDILFDLGKENPKLVIATKITTRERIVQPFVHQKILDSVFGGGIYKSILVAVSETQRKEEIKVNEICVPGQVLLYQRHLSRMYGFYYLDPPRTYLRKDFREEIGVYDVQDLFQYRLKELLEVKTN